MITETIIPAPANTLQPLLTGGAASSSGINPDLAEQVQKLVALKQHYFHYHRTSQVLEGLQQLRHFGNVGRVTKSPSNNLLLTGMQHTGKTSLLRHFEAMYPSVEIDNVTYRPVLFVEIIPNSTCKGVMVQTLRALGVPVGVNVGDTTVLGLKLIEWLRKKRVDVIIYDEFQHIVEEKTKTQIYNGGDLLKCISNSGVAIVVAGIKEAALAYEENVALEMRSIGRHELTPFKWHDEADRKVFLTLLAMFSEELPFPVKSDLAQLEISMPLYHMSQGLFGRTVVLLLNATTRGLMSGARSLDRKVLRNMVESFRNSKDPQWFNPFDVAGDKLRLTPAEPAIRERKTRLRNGKPKKDETNFMAI